MVSQQTLTEPLTNSSSRVLVVAQVLLLNDPCSLICHTLETMHLVATSRLPFDAAWGFDDVAMPSLPLPPAVVEEDAMSRGAVGPMQSLSFLGPLSTDVDTTFEFLKQSDSFSDLGDELSVNDGADVEPTAVVSNPESWRRGDCNEVSSTTSTRSEKRIEETKNMDFGPRGTRNMITFMRRSEETRMEIMAQLRTLPAQSVVVQDTNIKPFYKTKESRETLMTCFKKRKRRASSEGRRGVGSPKQRRWTSI